MFFSILIANLILILVADDWGGAVVDMASRPTPRTGAGTVLLQDPGWPSCNYITKDYAYLSITDSLYAFTFGTVYFFSYVWHKQFIDDESEDGRYLKMF